MGNAGIRTAMQYTHRDAASLGMLMAKAIPDLHGVDAIDVQAVDVG